MKVFSLFPLAAVCLSVFCASTSCPSTALAQAAKKPKAVLSSESEEEDKEHGGDESRDHKMFRFTQGSTFNMAFIPRDMSEYAEGDIRAPAQVYIWADPSLTDSILFVSTEWDNFVEKYVKTGMARIAFRPVTLTPKATAAANIMACVGKSAGIPMLQHAARIDPLWGTRPYDKAVEILVKAAGEVGVEPKQTVTCLLDGKLNFDIARYFAKDARRIDAWDEEDLNIYVNGGWWPGYEFWPLAKKQVELSNKDTKDVGDNNPLLTIQPGDRVLGNPNARVKLFDYGNVIRVQGRTFFKEGLDSRLRSFAATGDFAYIYRPFHFGGETRKSEIAAACVPQAKFFDFLDYLSQNKHFWEKLEKPSEIVELVAVSYGAEKSCFNDPSVAKKLDDARNEAIEKLGVIRVSTYFYRGIRHYGNLPFDELPLFIKKVDAYRDENAGNKN
ncbi:MAG: thioredoxin domain-containing protein [Proteobacteria bacterium]|nr:thioredoxin domain-containing protein [Pseudomonadota bacterium]